MTGRGAGYGAVFGVQRGENTAPGRGSGMSFLGGHGFRNRGFGRRGWCNMLCAIDLPRWMRLRGYATPNQ
jgi:hypothetical protein